MCSSFQIALLFIQLSFAWRVFSGPAIRNTSEEVVFNGDTVTFSCNISLKNATQITWKKDGLIIYSHYFKKKETFSNFSFERLRVHIDTQSRLIIPSAETDDAGLYICDVAELGNLQNIQWNLTVSVEPEGIPSLTYTDFILAPVLGFLLCSIIFAVCICRIPDDDQNQRRTMSYVLYRVQPRQEEVAPQQLKGSASIYRKMSSAE